MKTIIKKQIKTYPLKHGVKKASLKKIKKKLDELWALVIRNKNNGMCEICGKPAQNSHHIIGRTNYVLRWDILNGVNLCISCHVFGNRSAHSDPLFFVAWLQENRPDDYKYLRVKKNERFDKDYEAIENYLKEVQE